MEIVMLILHWNEHGRNSTAFGRLAQDGLAQLFYTGYPMASKTGFSLAISASVTNL